ncbi:MAG: polysaccharide deacetylase family protein [Desulfitobacteriaceae bacterium]
MCVGFCVAESLKPVYREIAGLLGISFAEDKEVSPGNKTLQNYDVLLVDGVDLSQLSGLEETTLIIVCGPVTGDGETLGLRLKTLSFNLGLEATRFLMEGRAPTEKDVGKPILDLRLEEIREVLHREVRNFLEIPPIPWGYSYAMILTHDIDILSLKEMPVARTFLGYFYRSSVLNWKRWRAGKVHTSEFYRTLWEMARTWAARFGIGKDVWQRALPGLLRLEKRLGVRSSLYFMPFPNKPGILPEPLRTGRVSAPANRAAFYNVLNYQEMLNSLEEGGWEAGVHGIDAWHDVQAARAEHGRVVKLTGKEEIGIRMHWLYFQSPHSFKALEEGGFKYDATFGYNEVVGFRAGTLQPYHPLNCQMLWEFPLHIQDGALMGEEHLDLNREDAFRKAKPILDWAKRFGGAVSLLWHNQSFTAPRFWGEVYERLIAQGRSDRAWIAVPRDVLCWYDQRRKCKAVLSREGVHWQISCTFPDQELIPSIPPIRIRLHLRPERVRSASVPYVEGDGYIDFPAQNLVTLEVEGED